MGLDKILHLPAFSQGNYAEKRNYSQEFKEQILKEYQEVGNAALICKYDPHSEAKS